MPAAAQTRVGRLLEEQDGFTLIELMVAVMILTVGTMALLGTFESSRSLATTAEKHATAQQIAQSEIARLTSQPWAKLALSGTPARNGGATVTDPTYYLVGGTCGTGMTPVASPCYQWDWSNVANVEPLAIDTTTGVDSPSPTAWSTTVSDGSTPVRLQGQVYRYITWVKDPGCTGSGSSCGAAGGAPDYKRVTVAVTVSGVARPTWLSTLVGNSAGGVNNPLTNAGTTCLDGGSSVRCTN